MIDEELLPTATEYEAAFAKIRGRLTPKQRLMLRYHLDAGRPVTATELAEKAGYASYRAVNAQYGRVGVYLRSELPKLRRIEGQQSAAFASFHKVPRADKQYSEWEWTLHGPVRRALERVKI